MRRVLALESDPIIKTLQESVYREILLRQCIDEAVQTVMMAYALSSDLDQLAVAYNVQRMTVTSANPDAVPPVDAASSSQIIVEQVIPEAEGGFCIREMGLFDADGVLIAMCNIAGTYKPQLQEGSGRTQRLRMMIIVSSTDAVKLKVDPSVVLATRQYVDEKVIEMKAYADSLLDAYLKAANPHTQYVSKGSPALTGVPKAPTAAAGTSTTQIASTAFVQNFIATVNSVLALNAPFANPALTGTPTAPTAAQTVNNTQIATTAFVKTAIAALAASSQAALDTLKELTDALGNTLNFATTMTNALAGKMDIAKNGSDIANFSAFLANLKVFS